MVVFVGLGNPGDEYYNTKHNAGYWIVDELAKRWVCDYKPGKDNYVFTEKKTEDVMLMKPTTGMNNSGLALKHFVKLFNIDLNPRGHAFAWPFVFLVSIRSDSLNAQ